MEIVDSLEVRWFFDGSHPAASVVRDWFGSSSMEERRVDYYLATNRGDIGFKARVVERQPVKVETKYLLGSLGAVHLSTGVVGNLERWRKLSLALDDSLLKRDGVWLAIQKERRLRKFAFEDGTTREVLKSARPVAGCGVELTRICCQLSEQSSPIDGWTLGLEAFGPESTLLAALQGGAREAFAVCPQIALGKECSASYPEWVKLRVGAT
ncbi:hypothetical protein KRR26_35565 [Corallococcus sp. M34]|uniref:hypothetical protein n=1 Tax=Citreicoccus inhibens TaxID=2849499 RepID=UPI001C24321E|nr:hypothetical protein [Citreicoccus inhibens]MBU8900929.1 hypothetical protein [Citreicoccus inhibens]